MPFRERFDFQSRYGFITLDSSREEAMTRRTWRKQRAVLSVGETGVVGVVKRYFTIKGFGYIQPSNNAKRILFRMADVPFDRQRFVQEGKTVHFDVAARANGELKACITFVLRTPPNSSKIPNRTQRRTS